MLLENKMMMMMMTLGTSLHILLPPWFLVGWYGFGSVKLPSLTLTKARSMKCCATLPLHSTSYHMTACDPLTKRSTGQRASTQSLMTPQKHPETAFSARESAVTTMWYECTWTTFDVRWEMADK